MSKSTTTTTANTTANSPANTTANSPANSKELTAIGGTTFTALKLDGVTDAVLKSYAEQLDKLEALGRNAAGRFIDEANRVRAEQARILAKVEADKAFAKGGFKSTTEYAVAIGFSEPTARALIASGRIYLNEKAPDALKALSPSSLAVLASAVKNAPEVVFKDAENGVIDAKTPQARLKEYAKGVNEASASDKPLVVKLFKPNSLYKPLLIPANTGTAEDLKQALEGAYASVERIAKDEDGNARFLVLTAEYADIIVLKPANEKPKKGAVTSFASSADFLKAKRAAGVDEESLRLACTIIGIEYTAPEA